MVCVGHNRVRRVAHYLAGSGSTVAVQALLFKKNQQPSKRKTQDTHFIAQLHELDEKIHVIWVKI